MERERTDGYWSLSGCFPSIFLPSLIRFFCMHISKYISHSCAASQLMLGTVKFPGDKSDRQSDRKRYTNKVIYH